LGDPMLTVKSNSKRQLTLYPAFSFCIGAYTDQAYWCATCPLSRVGTDDPWDPDCVKSRGMSRLVSEGKTKKVDNR
jgi:hypothetical protein